LFNQHDSPVQLKPRTTTLDCQVFALQSQNVLVDIRAVSPAAQQHYCERQD